MNFNYDLMTWIEFFIGAFACCLGSFVSAKILLDVKIKDIKIMYYVFLIILSALTLINSLVFDNIAKIFGIFTIIFVIYKIIFQEDIINSFLYSLITYIFFIISEITISMIALLLESIVIGDIQITLLAKTIFINIAVSFLSAIYSKLLKRRVKIIVNKLNNNKIFYIIVLGIIIIFILISSLYNLFINKWVIDYKFVLNTIIIIGCSILAIVLLKQYLKNKEINDKYLLLEDYLKTSAELIERYSTTIHKYKNNLIAIKGYLKTDEKKANLYIDDLLETYDLKKYNWFNKINNIQIDVLRYLIFYKLSKAENNDLKIVVDVSKDIKKYNNNNITIRNSNILLDIVGELFDNAIYASNESKEKELNVIIYEEDNNIVIIISNTYKGEVFLSLINKNGYTTKGNGHGLGLYDIDKTIKKEEIFDINYELIDNSFVAKLKVKIK